jgi:glycosyltransferase involved in cell wall biosynthesis
MNTVQSSHSVSHTVEEIELTVLMPCLNESETIGVCVAKAMKFLTEHNLKGEVVVADNGSRDSSQAIAENLGARVVHVPKRGYGAALIGGIEAARGRYIVMGDSDDSYDFSNLMPFLDQLRAGADLVMGNRFQGGIAPGAMPWLHRHLGNPVLSFIGRLFFNAPVEDFHCGLRAFRTSAVRSLGLQATGMEFASEMVVRSTLAGFAIQEVPTTLAADGRSRPPHLKTWRDGWRHLKFLLMYSPRWLFLLPGAAMVLLGFLLATALIAGPLPISHNTILDLNSFIGACFLVVVGTQFLTFGAMARLFATRAGFLPRTRRADFLFGWLSTDRLVQIAATLLAIGVTGLAWAIWQWMKIDFGPLNSPVVPRVLVSSLCTVVIAIQSAGSAFLLGILEIAFRRET